MPGGGRVRLAGLAPSVPGVLGVPQVPFFSRPASAPLHEARPLPRPMCPIRLMRPMRMGRMRRMGPMGPEPSRGPSQGPAAQEGWRRMLFAGSAPQAMGRTLAENREYPREGVMPGGRVRLAGLGAFRPWSPWGPFLPAWGDAGARKPKGPQGPQRRQGPQSSMASLPLARRSARGRARARAVEGGASRAENRRPKEKSPISLGTVSQVIS